MKKVLIIQGTGMDQRGLSQLEIFGPQTLAQINAQIEQCAQTLGMEVEIFQSNDEAQVISKLRSALPTTTAMIINPGGFTNTTGPLPDIIKSLPFPAFEVHASNPASRGVRSTILPVCRGAVCGFGYTGYDLALQAINSQY